MRTVPPQADPFPHPHEVRHSHAEVYRRGYPMSLGQKTHGTAHQVRGGSHGYVRNESVARCWIVGHQRWSLIALPSTSSADLY
jgi:hypothetical protein